VAPDRVPVLTDPDAPPDAARIREVLGGAFPAWQTLASGLAAPVVDLVLSWRHYRDGGWLCRALRGRRNVAWLAVWDGYATVTCYFAARHRDDLVALPVPEDVATRAATAEMSGAMLPLVIEIRSQADVDAALEVVRYRLRARRGTS
jgi:hypothetical protein